MYHFRINIVVPDEEPPSGRNFVRKLLEKRWKQEELELIIGIFNSICEAHSHLAMVTANLSSLAKVTDQETLKLIMKSVVWPLIQMNMPEGFLDPIKDKEPQMLEQELAEKVEKTILPRHKAACFKHKLKNGPMRILAAAIWLKLKRRYILMGMAKEACELFQVRAKQLSRALMGHKYLGGKKTPAQKGKGKKRKDAPLLTLPRGPRRAEMTGMNHPSKADHLLIYTSSSKTVSSITICSQNAFISSSAQRSSRGMASSFTHHIIHRSPFQYRWHIAGPFHDCSPVTTHSCLFPPTTMLS